MPTAQSSTTTSSSSSSGRTKSTEMDLKNSRGVEVQSQQVSSSSNSNSNTGTKTPPDQPEFIKQALITIEKKVRNLDKRRQKLEEYRASQRKGHTLNEDQLQAVSKYDEVMRTLELTKDLEKQFMSLATDAMKQQKKQAKKEQLEREEAVKEKLKEAQRYMSCLATFRSSAEVRHDFLAETSDESSRLSEEELRLIDDFDRMINCELSARFESLLPEANDHLMNLIDGKQKTILSSTYADLKRMLDRLIASSYWTAEKTSSIMPAASNTTDAESEGASQQVAEPVEQLVTSSVTTSVVEMENQAELMSQQQQIEQPMTTSVYTQEQSSTEDYVLVSSNDLSGGENTKQQSPNSYHMHQQQTKTTFFTTLNPADFPAHRNIDEFINKCENNDEGINFLQDSEIQSRQQQQQETGFTQNQQEYNQAEGQRENNFNNKPRNQTRNYQNNKPRYSDERRSGAGGPPRTNNYNQNQGGGAPPHRNNNGPASQGGPIRGGGGGGGGYRGGQSQRNGPAPGVGGGNYRGNNGSGQGPRSGGPMHSNGPRNNNINYQQPRNPDMHQQPQQQSV